MKYIGGGGGVLPDYWGGYILPLLLGFAPILIEFVKNIGKSRDKSYPTDQKTSSILVPTKVGTGAAITQALVLAKCIYCPLSQVFSKNLVPELVAQVRKNWVLWSSKRV